MHRIKWCLACLDNEVSDRTGANSQLFDLNNLCGFKFRSIRYTKRVMCAARNSPNHAKKQRSFSWKGVLTLRAPIFGAEIFIHFLKVLGSQLGE